MDDHLKTRIRIIFVERHRKQLMLTFWNNRKIYKNICTKCMEYFRQHYRMYKSVFHGACLLTGISIILFILQDLRNILVFIPGHRRSRCLKNV